MKHGVTRRTTHRDRERTCVIAQSSSISRPGPAECFQGDLEPVAYRPKKRYSWGTQGLPTR